MSQENAYQIGLFNQELVDSRTKTQKKKAKAREAPRQVEMFSQRDLAVFGANGRPRLTISPKTRIELAIQDARGEEEIVQQRQREIEENTYPMPWVDSQAAADQLEVE